MATMSGETMSGDRTILDRIVDARRASVAHRKRVLPDVALKMAVQKAEPPRNFAAALTRDNFNIIAELKKASPSLGIIRETYIPAELAPLLEARRRGALRPHRGGILPGLSRPPEGSKEGYADSHPAQGFYFRSVAGLGSARRRCGYVSSDRRRASRTEPLRELLDLGRSLQMEPLVEVHSRAELDRTIAAGAKIIGVNNRDLRDFSRAPGNIARTRRIDS